MKGLFTKLIAAMSLAFVLGCTNLDEIYYSEISQNVYFKTKENVYAALARPYTKWRGTHEFYPWMLQEVVTDEFCVTQKGTDYESGIFIGIPGTRTMMSSIRPISRWERASHMLWQ